MILPIVNNTLVLSRTRLKKEIHMSTFFLCILLLPLTTLCADQTNEKQRLQEQIINQQNTNTPPRETGESEREAPRITALPPEYLEEDDCSDMLCFLGTLWLYSNLSR